MTKPNPAAALWLATIALIVMAAMSAAIHEAAKVAPVGQLVFWRSFVALIRLTAGARCFERYRRDLWG